MLKERIKTTVHRSHLQEFQPQKQAQSGQKMGLLLSLAAIVPGIWIGVLGKPALADPVWVTPGYPSVYHSWPSQRVQTQIMTVGPARNYQPSITQPSFNQWNRTRILDRRWDDNRNDNWRDRRWDNHRDQDDWRDRHWDNRNSDQSRDDWRDRRWDRDRHENWRDRRSVIIVPSTGYSSYSRSVYQVPTCTTTVIGGLNSIGQGGVRFYSSSCN